MQLLNTPVFTGISANADNTAALDADGNAWVWGDNSYGQLGDGTTIDKLIPTQVQGVPKFSSIKSGGASTSAIDMAGNIWSWGNNDRGQLGDGTRVNKSMPTQLQGVGAVFSMIDIRGDVALGLDTNGDAWVWGNSSYGQLGNGVLHNSMLTPTPTRIVVPR